MLDKLPPELLSLVLAHLSDRLPSVDRLNDAQEVKETIYNCTLVSPAVSAVASAVLWRDVRIEGHSRLRNFIATMQDRDLDGLLRSTRSLKVYGRGMEEEETWEEEEGARAREGVFDVLRRCCSLTLLRLDIDDGLDILELQKLLPSAFPLRPQPLFLTFPFTDLTSLHLASLKLIDPLQTILIPSLTSLVLDRCALSFSHLSSLLSVDSTPALQARRRPPFPV
jgi:hypothetical protein